MQFWHKLNKCINFLINYSQMLIGCDVADVFKIRGFLFVNCSWPMFLDCVLHIAWYLVCIHQYEFMTALKWLNHLEWFWTWFDSFISCCADTDMDWCVHPADDVRRVGCMFTVRVLSSDTDTDTLVIAIEHILLLSLETVLSSLVLSCQNKHVLLAFPSPWEWLCCFVL